MWRLLAGMARIVFPEVRGKTRVSLRYLLLLVLIPATVGFLAWGAELRVQDPGILATSLGVLGGLLFAHAIFVFQLRSSYDARQIEPPKDAAGNYAQEDLRVRPLIDEMFNGVLYASLVALVLTLFSGISAAFAPENEALDPTITVASLVLITHLAGCIWHVITATTTAYATLKKHDR